MATAKHKAGELTICPWTTTVSCCATLAKVPLAGSVVKISNVQDTLARPVFYLEAPSKSSGCVSPFWYVGTTNDKTKANVHLASMQVHCNANIKTSSKKVCHDRKVDFQVLVNSKVINEGEEVLLFIDSNKRQRQ